MNNIFTKDFYLVKNQDNCISLFENTEAFEIFQMRIGLESLCQNTLVYSTKKNFDGQLDYVIHASPHSDKFYNESCLKFCNGLENSRECTQMMLKVANYFFKSQSIEKSEIPAISFYSYDEANPGKKYICYQCPFVHLYKCAFPIYVEDTVVAVLFTGQFPVGIPTKIFPWVKLKRPASDSMPSIVFNRHFKSKQSLMNFIKQNLLPVISSFSQKAQENLLEQQEKALREKIEKQILCMEAEITSLLANMSNSFALEDAGNMVHNQFWNIVSKSLAPYLEEIEANSFFVFVDETSSVIQDAKTTYGTQLYPNVKQNSNVIFKFHCSLEDKNENTIYTRDEDGSLINDNIFSYLTDQENILTSERCDIVIQREQFCPFAVVINYTHNAKILNKRVLQRRVLDHLKSFFLKVSQELIHLSILRSEQINKSVLRIYRHEIIHQLQVLKHNNLFLDTKKLRETDENKLRHVAEDQRQCIHELTFITRNINVFTGKVSKQSVNIDKEQLIDVDSNIINKAISLYQRAKRDKSLWFLVQNRSANNIIKSNQSLLDMIFFNLMSNAIKYAYSGTKIIIGFDDSNNYSRPHTISLTDFGTPVEADYHNQVFQMYFRGNNTADQIEGSGIGLYVANEIANILNLKLTWKSKKISDYNIPLLMRYLSTIPDIQTFPHNMPQLAREEYKRLVHNKLISQVFNDEYLENPSEWNQIEIEEDLFRPTYKVTFEIEL